MRRVTYQILVSFFVHIIALDRLTDPSHPILLSETLEKTHVHKYHGPQDNSD